MGVEALIFWQVLAHVPSKSEAKTPQNDKYHSETLTRQYPTDLVWNLRAKNGEAHQNVNCYAMLCHALIRFASLCSALSGLAKLCYVNTMICYVMLCYGLIC